MLGALVNMHFPSVSEWVIIVIVAVIFSILKYLLNRLTDRIANRTIEKEANEQKRWATTANVTLQTPSSLTIIRDSSPVAALVPTIIYLVLLNLYSTIIFAEKKLWIVQDVEA